MEALEHVLRPLALSNQLAGLADLGYGNDRYKLGHHRRKWFIMCSIRFLLGWERAIRTKFGLQRNLLKINAG
jgi:hypothetical protein